MNQHFSTLTSQSVCTLVCLLTLSSTDRSRQTVFWHLRAHVTWKAMMPFHWLLSLFYGHSCIDQIVYIPHALSSSPRLSSISFEVTLYITPQSSIQSLSYYIVVSFTLITMSQLLLGQTDKELATNILINSDLNNCLNRIRNPWVLSTPPLRNDYIGLNDAIASVSYDISPLISPSFNSVSILDEKETLDDQIMKSRYFRTELSTGDSSTMSRLPSPQSAQPYNPPYRLLPTELWRCCQCQDGMKTVATQPACTYVKSNGNTCGHVRCSLCYTQTVQRNISEDWVFVTSLVASVCNFGGKPSLQHGRHVYLWFLIYTNIFRS